MDARSEARISFEDTRRTDIGQEGLRLRRCGWPSRLAHLCTNSTRARKKLIRRALSRSRGQSLDPRRSDTSATAAFLPSTARARPEKRAPYGIVLAASRFNRVVGRQSA